MCLFDLNVRFIDVLMFKKIFKINTVNNLSQLLNINVI